CGSRRRGARRAGFGPGRLRGRGSPRGRHSGRASDGGVPGREVRDALLAGREVGGDLRSLRRELRRTVGGAPLGRGDLAPLAPEREPAAHLPDEASESSKGARSRRGRRGHIEQGGFVILYHTLIASGGLLNGLYQSPSSRLAL